MGAGERVVLPPVQGLSLEEGEMLCAGLAWAGLEGS